MKLQQGLCGLLKITPRARGVIKNYPWGPKTVLKPIVFRIAIVDRSYAPSDLRSQPGARQSPLVPRVHGQRPRGPKNSPLGPRVCRTKRPSGVSKLWCSRSSISATMCTTYLRRGLRAVERVRCGQHWVRHLLNLWKWGDIKLARGYGRRTRAQLHKPQPNAEYTVALTLTLTLTLTLIQS